MKPILVLLFMSLFFCSSTLGNGVSGDVILDQTSGLMWQKKEAGEMTWTEVITVRFDPKLKYLTELLARKQRRTISSFIEWAVEETVKNTNLGCPIGSDNPTTAWDVKNIIWDTDQVDRLIKLVKYFPDLLSFEEERLWKLIEENGYFWKLQKQSESKLSWNPKEGDIEQKLIKKNVREQWDNLLKVINDEIDESVIPSAPVSVYSNDFEIELDQYVSKKEMEKEEEEMEHEIFGKSET